MRRGVRLAEVPADAIDVLGDVNRVRKYVAVDSLQHVAFAPVAMRETDEPRVVDVTAAIHGRGIEMTRQFEVLQDVREIVLGHYVTVTGCAVCQAPRVKSGKSFELPRSAFDASLSGVTADQAAAS